MYIYLFLKSISGSFKEIHIVEVYLKWLNKIKLKTYTELAFGLNKAMWTIFVYKGLAFS